jgi:hypothetical protein
MAVSHVNKYFQNFTYAGEQDMVEDLMIEAIKVYGVNVKYMPKTIVKRDDAWGEDVLRQFNIAAEIEMYVKNTEGFEGEGDLMSRAGLEIHDEMTLTVARKRWSQVRVGESLFDEMNNVVQLETANTAAPANSAMILLEAGTAGTNGYSISTSRPQEGDVLLFPLNNKLYEVKFVEHEEIFYQTGKLQSYDLRCELFTYSSEMMDTGDVDIDAVETSFSLDLLDTEVLLESGDKLLNEDGDKMLLQSRLAETADPQANNEFFQLQADSIMDFSERNPFSEVDRF